jgi:hypothetical protein
MFPDMPKRHPGRSLVFNRFTLGRIQNRNLAV